MCLLKMTNDIRHIDVASDFDRFPGGRYRKHGRASGEAFRDDLLIPALSNSGIVAVNFDGTEGYGSGFLEEAFGGLLRKGLSYSDLQDRLRLIGQEPESESYIEEAWQYITEQAQRSRRQAL